MEVNLIKKTVRYRSVTKTIADTYWDDEIIPFLYPTWDSDKDRLVLFGWYSNNTYIAQRRKYTKDFKTGEFYWKDYEMEQLDESASGVYEKFKEAFFLADSLDTQEYEKEFARIHAATSSVSWLSVRLARNFLLDETDHVFIEDSPYSVEEKEMYRLYRQKLRDLPNSVSTTDPIDVRFPLSPKYFKEIWAEKNPDAEYLQTEDQYVKLASHYLTTFREKIASYLISRSITENLFFKTFVDSLKKSGILFEDPIVDGDQNMSEEEKQKVKDLLETIIKTIEENENV